MAGHVSDEDRVDWFVDRVTRLYSARLAVEEAQIGPGLLVDVPAYVEKGLQMAAYDLPVDAVDDTEGSELRANALGDDREASLVEELIAEAYLVSVGNLVAKYEPDLLDDLGACIARSEALTPANWVWVKENLQAMRA